MKSKFNAVKNSIISFVMGDMMGTPVQFITRKMLLHRLENSSIEEVIQNIPNKNLPFGVWSDDSSMTLCTMKSIVEKQEIDIENMSEYFLKWLYDAYLTPLDKTFDVGRTTYAALNNFKNNPDIQSGLTSTNSNGNGSLMRILPISVYCYFKKLSKQETFETIKTVSSITHAHPISILGCYIYTLIVFDILKGFQKNEILSNLKSILYDEVISDDCKEWLTEYKDLLNGNIINKQENEIESIGYVRYTLEVAFWGFYHTESVEDCIFKITKLGHDTDTNSAVGASLSGLYYGLNGCFIQQKWVEKIIKKEMIFDTIEEYMNVLKELAYDKKL